MFDFEPTDAQRLIVEQARSFARTRILPLATACDRDASFPRELVQEAWELGFLTSLVPAEFGGRGYSHLDASLIAEELAYGCTGIQMGLTANTLGLAPIGLAGSDEQKKKYLGWAASEPIFGSCAITEPEAGSEVANLATLAVPDGGGSHVLSGTKSWVMNPRAARFFTVFATTDRALRGQGIAAFIVDADSPGLTIGEPDPKQGQRAMETATIQLDAVRVSQDNVLAPAGEGAELAFRTFDIARPELAATAVGLMRRCFDECVQIARTDTVFGAPIASHQLAQAQIAEIAIRVEAATLLARKSAWAQDRGESRSRVSSCAKAYGGDAAVQTTLDALHLTGGAGYLAGHPIEKLVRDAKYFQLSGGGGCAGFASQIQRLMIAASCLKG